MEHNFEDRYRNGETPWDHGQVDCNLVDMVAHNGIQPCRALDIGCGTGDNAIWLAQQGFEVVACDLSATAIDRAKAKARAAGAESRFVVADFLSDKIAGATFGLVIDRGCLHSVPGDENRRRFAQRVADLLQEGGMWFSLVGNADEPEWEVGPPQLSATELASIVEPCFEILSLATGHFGSSQETPPRAWICLMRKRAG
ncbi:MAG: methyltransferase domain-containing protein [Kiritimatiellales bacterium]|nr:methyltransferase domain-containing protein [Kiritimatiellales bacterium]MCF7864753.1 methyltransferase domain-containing protein [Kiritimatiellales bacterium]